MEIIQDFRKHLQRLGYSKSSVQMLPGCVAEFLKFSQKTSTEPSEVTMRKIVSKDITAYHEYLQERPNQRRAGGLSESYINHHIYSLKLFFAYQLEIGKLATNPISSMEFPRPKTKPRAILTLEEMEMLYGVSKNHKEKAVLSLFYGCGLRRTEGENLNLKDIHFISGILYVRQGKGSKRRAVPMNEKVSRDLKTYALMERNPKGGETAFMTNRIGTRTSGNSYNNILKKILERTDIKKEITLHCLRHSIATHLLESGLSVEYVRDFLGHKHLESTQIYTRVKSKQLWNLNSI